MLILRQPIEGGFFVEDREGNVLEIVLLRSKENGSLEVGFIDEPRNFTILRRKINARTLTLSGAKSYCRNRRKKVGGSDCKNQQDES